MIRLFLAIDIPKIIIKEVQEMGRSIPNARQVPINQLHITLKFIGEVDEITLLDIQKILREIRQPKFSLCLKGGGTFPPIGTPRILWAGVHPEQKIIDLKNCIERELAVINIPKAKKKYTPHLTLARLRNSPVQHVDKFLSDCPLLQTSFFSVQTFNLYSSQLTQKGAIHTLESCYSLT
ncbi:MAG: 2'-5' RNA ligase [Desulforhopalus sp.]|jgi:2'-5' RNA ligase